MTWYVANLIGENIVAETMPVESRPNPLAFGDSGEFVYVLYGDRETGVTVCLDAADEQEAERLIRSAFECYLYDIDDLQESAAQEPPANLSFVVSTCHGGTDWCVRAATQREINDPDEETLPYDEAVALAGEHGRFFDFSTDFNRSDDEQNDEDATPDKRTILVHLNVEVPAGDVRSADEIAGALMAALEVGSDDDSVRALTVVCPMAEEVLT